MHPYQFVAKLNDKRVKEKLEDDFKIEETETMLAKCITAKREINLILTNRNSIKCGIFNIKVKRIKHELNKRLDLTIDMIVNLIQSKT